MYKVKLIINRRDYSSETDGISENSTVISYLTFFEEFSHVPTKGDIVSYDGKDYDVDKICYSKTKKSENSSGVFIPCIYLKSKKQLL